MPNTTSTRDEDTERGDEIDHAGREVDEVFTHGDQRRFIADDVAEQLEEGKDEHEHDKCNEHHYKCHKEFAEDVLVEDERKTAAGRAFAGGDLYRASGGGRLLGAQAEPVAERGECRDSGAAGGHLAQQHNAAHGKDQVGLPNAEEDGDLVLASERGAGGREEVVDEDQGNGENEAGAFAAAPR